MPNLDVIRLLFLTTFYVIIGFTFFNESVFALQWKVSPSGHVYPIQYEEGPLSQLEKDGKKFKELSHSDQITILLEEQKKALKDEEEKKEFLKIKKKKFNQSAPEVDLQNLIRAQKEYLDAQNKRQAFDGLFYDYSPASVKNRDSDRKRKFVLNSREIQMNQAFDKIKKYQFKLKELNEKGETEEDIHYEAQANYLAAQQSLIQYRMSSNEISQLDAQKQKEIYEDLKNVGTFQSLSPFIASLPRTREPRFDSERYSVSSRESFRSRSLPKKPETKKRNNLYSPHLYSPEMRKLIDPLDKEMEKLRKEHTRLAEEMLDISSGQEKGKKKEKEKKEKLEKNKQEISEIDQKLREIWQKKLDIGAGKVTSDASFSKDSLSLKRSSLSSRILQSAKICESDEEKRTVADELLNYYHFKDKPSEVYLLLIDILRTEAMSCFEQVEQCERMRDTLGGEHGKMFQKAENLQLISAYFLKQIDENNLEQLGQRKDVSATEAVSSVTVKKRGSEVVGSSPDSPFSSRSSSANGAY